MLFVCCVQSASRVIFLYLSHVYTFSFVCLSEGAFSCFCESRSLISTGIGMEVWRDGERDKQKKNIYYYLKKNQNAASHVVKKATPDLVNSSMPLPDARSY